MIHHISIYGTLIQLSHGFFALVYRYSNTEITPAISRDGFRNVLLAVRAEACRRFCGSMMLAEALAEAPGDPTQDLKRCSRKLRGSTCQEIVVEGSVEARCLEVPTKRKLVFAEARGRKGCYFQRNQ